MIAFTDRAKRDGNGSPNTLCVQISFDDSSAKTLSRISEALAMALARLTLPAGQQDLFSDYSDFSESASCTATAEPEAELRQRPLFPDFPLEHSPPANPPVDHEDLHEDPASFLGCYLRRMQPTLKLETDSWGDIRSVVREFQRWLDLQRKAIDDPRSINPGVDSSRPELLAHFYDFQLSKWSPRTADRKLGSLKQVWEFLYDAGVFTVPTPKIRPKQIKKKRGVSSERKVPVGVSHEDMQRICEAIVALELKLTWPKIAGLEPWLFWLGVFQSGAFHGLNPGDVFGVKKKHAGLLKSEVTTDTVPPFPGGESLGVTWPHGFLQLKRNKTGSQLIAPLSPHLAGLIAAASKVSKGDRVFGCLGEDCKSAWYRSVNQIKKKAGLLFSPSQIADAAQRGCYDVSLSGQAPSRSYRKRAAILWQRHVSRTAASLMMAHSIRTGSSDDVVSKVTEENYSQSETYREIILGAPKILALLPPGGDAASGDGVACD